MDTPLTAKTLSEIAAAHGWTQTHIARETKLVQSTVSAHLNGTRAIRDEHLVLYVRLVPELDKARLVAAWLHDVLPADDRAAVLDVSATRVSDDTKEWEPSLSPAQRRQLNWLASQVIRDPDYAKIIEIFAKNAGLPAGE